MKSFSFTLRWLLDVDFYSKLTIDICVVVLAFDSLSFVKRKSNGELVQKRSVTLGDIGGGVSFPLMLWAERAVTPPFQIHDSVIFTNCATSHYNSVPSVSLTWRSQIYASLIFGRNGPKELKTLQDWWSADGCFRKRFPTMKRQELTTVLRCGPGVFESRATLMGIRFEEDWTYRACPVCEKKLIQTHPFACKNCGQC